MSRASRDEVRMLATNREARHRYELMDRLEAGIELEGPEVKSIRAGRANLKEAHVQFSGGEAFLVGCHVSPYENAGYAVLDPVRRRRLLLTQREISRWSGRVQEKGLTVVPVSLYLKGPWIKLEIALARGKNLRDKRETLRRRTLDREAEQAIKDHGY